MRFDALGVSVDGFKEKVKALEETGMDADAAFKEAFLQQAEAQLERVGSAADTSAGKIARMEAAIANMSNAVKDKLIPTVTGFSDYVYLMLEGDELLIEALNKTRREITEGSDDYGSYKEAMIGVAEAAAKLGFEFPILTEEIFYAKMEAKDADTAMLGYANALMDVSRASKEAVVDTYALVVAEEESKAMLSELSLMMKTDLSGSYEDVIDKKQTLITKIEKLQTEINTLSGDYDTNRKKIFDLTEEMEKTYLEIEKVSEAWELQAKKMVFSLAEQRLAMDGWTNEELIALGKLAGPEGLGLVDEAWAALIGKIGEASTVMDAQGDQSNEFVGILNNVAGALGDASGEASRLRDNINSIQSRTVSVTTNYYSANYSTGAPRSYGGPRATGGPVDPSHYYSVAERESEVFIPSSGGSDALFLPKEPGKIVPASQMGGEGGGGGDLVIHTLNINNGMDVNEFDAMARSWFNG